jgi:diguanylate cyclase (GGDEF)-like protein
VAPLEWRIWTKDGAWRQVETISSNLLADPTIGKVVLTTRDVGERGALRMQVAQAGLRDVLTGLPNRLLFEDRLTQALAASQRGASAVAVVLLDLDGFSRLNGSFGHHVGDRVLREVARRLSGEIRASDTVARVGGDAFGILIAPGSAAVEALEVAARVRTALREPMSEGPTTFELTASIGIAGSDGSARIDAADLIRNADIAMTLAGNDGTDRLVVFEESMQRDLEGRFELEADLRHAVAAGQLVLQYQPIVDLATRELVGAEALVRWDHPVQGRLAPGLFIPIAEQAGLIEDIGGWVLREACREVAQWARLAPGRVPRVSVNLAAPQLANPQLPWLVKSTLAEAGAAPSWLTLEVTESLLVSDVLEVLGRLHAIRALGVKISVDDFGTGYSSLAYLQQFPVNHIKIDRSFVMPLDDGGNERGLVPAIVEIGRALGMSTIAEGIETERQLQRLIAMGCNLGQGYLFARPLDASAMRDLVRGAMAMPSAA